MYVIIPASDMETSLFPMSNPMCKTLVPINGKPVLQYILDELYSYQAYVDEIVVVKKDVSDIKEYLKYNKQDDFFLTKIHCIDGKDYKHFVNPEYNFLDDIYTAVEFLVDEMKVSPSEILVWSADELVFNSNKLVDTSTGSFFCMKDLKEVKIYRFDYFVGVVNTLVYLKNDKSPHTIKDFMESYGAKDKLSCLTNFGDYKEWKDRHSYYQLQNELIQSNEHSFVKVEIDLDKEVITKINKYADEPYSYEIMEKSRAVQYDLWSEANFLESANSEQGVFLPRFIERGVNKRGFYCDTVTQEFVSGSNLDSLLLNADLSQESWSNLLGKIVSVNKEVFHKDSLEDDDELNHSYVPKKKREEFVDEYATYLSSVLETLSQTFAKDYEPYNYYFLTNNDIAEWKMFFDVFVKEYAKYITKDTLIYNGSCERFVHNNLLFENIIYDTFTNKLTFINPRSREHQLVDKNKDFARLYLSTYCGYNALLNEKYSEERGIISLSDKVLRNMEMCENALDEIFEEDNFYLKHYALILMLEMATHEELSISQRVSLIKYANQLKKRFIFKKI